MNHTARMTRLAAAVGAGAAMFTFAMAGPAAATPGNGANQPCGSYCPTNVGSATGNGSGNGKATGQPAAGMVGKADAKNPPGQYPNGTDPNAGYECDRNQGVGQSNPAHTTCRSS